MASLTSFQSSSSLNNDKLHDENPENSISIFSTDYKKHDDLKQMLDSNKDNLKLDAMKRIIGMIAKNKDASDLFPAVVKNVVSKNMEVKKLVYVYLMRYAEEQQDLALLSISTFQRALKDPNPLIRASALRVLSSIRVPIIVTIMLLAIKEAVNDMSPFVRKTAANAIAKLYSLEAELKEDLVMIIEKLLSDKTTLVAGSAIQAFEEVCPERNDLIHRNFRKLCNLTADIDEWGQVMIVNMLTRYSRTQFVDPNISTTENNEKGEDNSNDEEYDGMSSFVLDPDHRLLLKSMKPLLQSRNSAVVMAVAQLYYYLAPKSEIQLVAKSLIRLLRSHREVQIVVLKNIVTIAQKHKTIFDPHLKSFYVHSNDSIHIKLLKLEILTCLASESNISIILREFQTYVLSSDKEFAAATIHAIGRCASSIVEVTEACLNGLVTLMSKKDENIVAESVVVIKRLLQLNPAKNKEIIKHMAKIIDKITIPMARASILWLIGEYSDRIPKVAPDVLRKMAKVFCEEEDIVKLQTMNLAVKLFIINAKQTTLLVQYIFNLAKYDSNYDIRDRARFLKALILNNDKCTNLNKHAKKILLATKPAPLLESVYKNSDQFQLGTLSHAINIKVNGYKNLPDFPTVAPDPTVRNVPIPVKEETAQSGTKSGGSSKTAKISSQSSNNKDLEENFYSNDDEDDKSVSTEGPDPSSKEESSEESSSSDSDSDSSSSSKSSVKSEKTVKPKEIQNSKKVNSVAKMPIKESSSASSSDDSSSSSSDSEDETVKKVVKKPAPSKEGTKKTTVKQETSLLDLDFDNEFTSTNYSSKKVDIIPSVFNLDLKSLTEDKAMISNESSKPKKFYEMLNKLNGNGLQIQYAFKRQLHSTSNKITNIELIFNNLTNSDIDSVKLVNKKLQDGNSAEIGPMKIAKNDSQNHSIAIDLMDSTTPIQFDLFINEIKKSNLSIQCPPGELLIPNSLSESDFDKNQSKLKGMNEISSAVELSNESYKLNFHNMKEKALEIANMCQISSSNQDVIKFAAI